jgi:hypothetical protein
MKTVLAIIFTMVQVSFAQIDTAKTYNWTSVDALIWAPITQVNFGGTFSISWKNKTIEVIYEKDTTPTESIKKFFEWLQQYIKEDYYIIKKDELDKLLKSRGEK